MKIVKTFAAFIIALAACIACEDNKYQSFSGYAQGGTYKVTADLSSSKLTKKEIANGIDSLLTLVDSTFSGYNKSSQLTRFNRGELVSRSAEFDKLVEISKKYKELSGGAFNVEAAPVFDVWGFGFTADSLPSDEMIKNALELSAKGEKLNFNAIAQGYTCDLIADYLHGAGIENMLVYIGEIYCAGVNPEGKNWSIGIDTPEDGNNSPGSLLSGIWKSDGRRHGVVTSGNYRKFYIHNGQKYAHTIDPRSGLPVQHNLLSATVIAPTATEADALATYFMVIGAKEALEWVEKHEGIEACLICSDSTICSSGFKLE